MARWRWSERTRYSDLQHKTNNSEDECHVFPFLPPTRQLNDQCSAETWQQDSRKLDVRNIFPRIIPRFQARHPAHSTIGCQSPAVRRARSRWSRQARSKLRTIDEERPCHVICLLILVLFDSLPAQLRVSVTVPDVLQTGLHLKYRQTPNVYHAGFYPLRTPLVDVAAQSCRINQFYDRSELSLVLESSWVNIDPLHHTRCTTGNIRLKVQNNVYLCK